MKPGDVVFVILPSGPVVGLFVESQSSRGGYAMRLRYPLGVNWFRFGQPSRVQGGFPEIISLPVFDTLPVSELEVLYRSLSAEPVVLSADNGAGPGPTAEFVAAYRQSIARWAPQVTA